MSPLFATRRRADEFEAVLAGHPAQGASDQAYDELLALVGALRAVPQPQPRPEFVADLRTSLVAEAATMPARQDADVDRLRLRAPDPGRVRSRRERGIAIAMGGFALVAATTSLGVVAQSALPGEALYPLKRGIESAHAGVSVGDQSKGTTLLSSASRRLDEVSRLDADDHEAEIADTLDDFTNQATEASDLLLASYAETGDDQTVIDLRSFTASSMESLAELDGELPSSARDEWARAVTTLVRIDDEAQVSCPTCAGADLGDIAPALPMAGTSLADGALPAADLPSLVLPSGVLPSVGLPSVVLPSPDGALPPGSVTEAGPSGGPTPAPTAGSVAGPAGGPAPGPAPGPGAGAGGGPADGPTAAPPGVPTVLPTQLPTAGPIPTVPANGQPTDVPTGAAPLPTVGVTQLLEDPTDSPLPAPLPSADPTALLGDAGSPLPTGLTGPVDGVLP